MANDRGRRGGRAGAKSGRGRGRPSTPAEPTGRGDNGAGGGRGGGTGSTRGGSGQQPRRGGRGGKRAAGPDSPVAGGGPLPSAKAKNVSHVNKKARANQEKVLWSPGKAAVGGPILQSGGAGITGDGRGGISSSSRAHNLSSLASSFRERYGEDVGLDYDETEGSDGGRTASTQPVARHKRGSPSRRGGAAAPVEEIARSMSPARLAAEAQKARARAREARFGGGSRAASLLTRPSPSGKPMAPDPPPLLLLPEAPPNDANGPKADGERKPDSGKAEGGRFAATSSPARVASISAPRFPVPTSVTERVPGNTVSATGASRFTDANAPLGVSVVSPPGTPRSLPPAASTSAASAPAPSTATPPIATEEIETRVPGAAGDIATAGDTVSPEEESMRGTAVKRSVPEGGGVVVIEPPAKKPWASSSPSSSSPPQGGPPGKVHTLRLRLRTDVISTPSHAPSSGGVEECKSFDPPNSPTGGGVEECKGFDPPNLPSTLPRREPAPPLVSPVAASMPSVLPSQSAASRPPVAPMVDAGKKVPATGTTVAVSRSSSAGLGAVTSPLVPNNSWGPSFGILSTTAVVTAASAEPAPADAPSNPWVLSPDAPTFARNQGRPLARSFSQTTAASTGAANGENERPVSSSERAGLNAVRPAVASGGSGGGRGAIADAVQNETAASRPPPGSPSRTPPPAAVARAENGAEIRRAQVLPGAAERSVPSPIGQGEVSWEESAMEIEEAMQDAGAAEIAAAAAAAAEAEAAAADVRPEEVVMGVRVSVRAVELLERLKREREESLDFERKLTQAMLDT